MLIPDLEQQERTARSLPVQQNDPKRTETDTISRNIMDLDDLTWALTEEQKRCIERAKNESSVEKVVPKPLPACPVLMDDKFI